MRRLVLAVATAALPAFLALPPSARGEDQAVRYRGTVEVRDGERVTIRQAEGSRVEILMNPRTRLLAANEGRVRDIKPESYLSVIATPGPDGQPKPARVAIYSPSERGFEQGSRAWDSGPGATFTAGWIDDLTPMPERRVTLRYEGGQKTFTIPRDTDVTQIAPGEKAQLVPGAAVTAVARRDEAGTLHGELIAVGRQGATPGL